MNLELSDMPTDGFGTFGDTLPLSSPFKPISLERFKQLCRAAGVPMVKAQKITSIPKALLTRIEEQPQHFESYANEIEAAKEEGYMLRWDCCASQGIKHKMATGNPEWEEACNELFVAEMRTFDVILQHPREMVPVWKRPWVEAVIENDYPVEVRVFVEEGKIRGISNYYPQRPLSDSYYTLGLIRKSEDYTEALIDAVPDSMVWRDGMDPTDEISFTADYILLTDGSVKLLEGGPPHKPGWGAHPCCFEPGDIEGLALSDRNPGE